MNKKSFIIILLTIISSFGLMFGVFNTSMKSYADETTEIDLFTEKLNNFNRRYPFEGEEYQIESNNLINIQNEIMVDISSVEEKMVNEENNINTAENKSGRKGLFLRFDTDISPQIKVCENLISIFEGSLPVYFFYADSKKYILKTKCDCNDVMLNELKKILGNGNVIFNH